MQTKLIPAERPGAIEEAAALLQQGQLVAFPTDTLYGVGADAFNPAAIARLYRAKRRPAEKGIPILLADLDDLEKVVADVPELARTLMAQYWPGPLTLILPRRPGVPAALSPNTGVAVRIPDHALARRLIRAAGGAVAASSANLAGAEPATTAAEALATLQGQVAAVLDGGPAAHGQASTVLDCTTDPPRLLRRGPALVEEFLLTAA